MSKAIPTSAQGVQLGRYRVEAELGRGGMGVVYACMDEPLGRRVALKTLSVGMLGRDREARMTRFKREVKALTQLDHPGILHIYDAGEADDPVVGWVLYYAMELIEGETLSERLIRGGAMDRGAACAVVAKCAEALGSAHKRGIVHRDVKPANIFLAEGSRVVVADFGVCKIEGGQEITRKDQMVGTPSYLAPEQILGLHVDPRTDVFALGALLYVLITNTALRPQLDRAGLSRLAATDDAARRAMAIKNAVAGLPEVIARALARDPLDRYADGAALAEALEPFASRVPEPFEESHIPAAQRIAVGEMTHSAFTSATNDGGPPAAAGSTDEGTAAVQDLAEAIGGDTSVDSVPPDDAVASPVDESTERVPGRSGRRPDHTPTARQKAVEDASVREESGPRWLVVLQARPDRVTLAVGAFLVLVGVGVGVGLLTRPRRAVSPPVASAPEPTPPAEALAPPRPSLPASCQLPEGAALPSIRELDEMANKASALEKRGDFKAAARVWETALAKDAGWVTQLSAARAFKRAGQADRARAAFGCVVAARSGHPEAEAAAVELKDLEKR